MSEQVYNVGIIGAGGIALKMHLPEIARTPGLRVTHLAGRRASRLQTLAARFDVPHWTMDADLLLSDPNVDGIIVALPHPLHVAWGLKALRAGKHLLMQKPLCADLNEADQLVAEVERSDRTVLALPAFGPPVPAMADALRAGRLGRPTGAYCRVSHGGPEVYYAEIRDEFGETDAATSDGLWFFQPGEASVGALFDMGVYAVAALVAILGRVVGVTGHVATLDKPTTLEDTATLLLHCANGIVATVETGWCDPARTHQIRIHGTKGKLEMPGRGDAPVTFWQPGSLTREDAPPLVTDLDLTPYPARNPHEQWRDCIRAGIQPPYSHVQAARHVTEILLAGLESARTGQRVPVHSAP